MCDEDTGQDLRAGRLSFLSTTLVFSYFSISELIIRLGAMKGSDFLYSSSRDPRRSAARMLWVTEELSM